MSSKLNPFKPKSIKFSITQKKTKNIYEQILDIDFSLGNSSGC